MPNINNLFDQAVITNKHLADINNHLARISQQLAAVCKTMDAEPEPAERKTSTHNVARDKDKKWWRG